VDKPDQSLDYSEKLRCAGTSYLGGYRMALGNRATEYHF
jgi:hypothetical protein